MEDNPDAICQWNHCEASANKHVRFGFQIHELADGPCGNATTTMPDHYDLCDDHVVESQGHYHKIVVDDLGECPSACREQIPVPERLTADGSLIQELPTQNQ